MRVPVDAFSGKELEKITFSSFLQKKRGSARAPNNDIKMNERFKPSSKRAVRV